MDGAVNGRLYSTPPRLFCQVNFLIYLRGEGREKNEAPRVAHSFFCETIKAAAITLILQLYSTPNSGIRHLV